MERRIDDILHKTPLSLIFNSDTSISISGTITVSTSSENEPDIRISVKINLMEKGETKEKQRRQFPLL